MFQSRGIARGVPVEVIVALCVWWCKRWLLRPAWRWRNRPLTDSSIYLTDSFQRFISVILVTNCLCRTKWPVKRRASRPVEFRRCWLCLLSELIRQLPTLHCTVVGLTRERFVALGLLSWTHLRTRYWGVFTLQGLKDLLRALGLCYCESWEIGENEDESRFHYTKVLFVGVVGIADMWFYLV